MSGSGSRFVAAGYTTLKPLIEVEGRPIIEHVVSMFPGESDFLFICADDALSTTPLRQVLQRICPRGKIVPIAAHKRGPVHAVLQAREYIRQDAPVIVNYCDFGMEWSYPDFRDKVKRLGCAGALVAYRGFHPHSLGPNLYAYVRHKDNYLLEIREKHCFTERRMEEYASTGTHYFHSGHLLLRYFDQAVTLNLQTNGEFYASSPYNLLVRDGLDVLIHEVSRFFQWGTPDDLEEYLGWSDYFLKAPNECRIAQKGSVLVTMAGSGARFAQEGYKEPKSLIEVDGEPMVRRALRSLPRAERRIVVCRTELANHRAFQSAVADPSPTTLQVVAADRPTDGQASTCLLARDCLDPLQPVLVAPCDTVVAFDEKKYANLTANPDVDCVVWTFQNHPHANRNPEQYAWVVSAGDGTVQQVVCKQPPLDDLRKARGVTGIFWFRRAMDLMENAEQLIASHNKVKGEFYLDSVIPLLIQKDFRVLSFPVRHYVCLGTPDDVRTYEYWAPYFRQLQTQRAGEILQ
jgi:NDP-sugar pyrophosphorylase family protein